MSTNLSKHILATITYYDVMDYPMTSFEIWKHLLIISGEEPEKYSLEEVICELSGDLVNTEYSEHGTGKLKRFIAMEKGFYFLKDRIGLADERIRRNKISEQKFKKLLKMVKILRFFPYIRMVGVTGRMAMKNAEAKSDFDLLIFFRKGRLFTGRILVTVMLHLFGKRRYGKKIQNRICLNHFLTDDFLISGRDIFAASEYSFMTVIYGFSKFERFQSINYWINRYKPNFIHEISNSRRMEDTFFSRKVKIFLEMVFNFEFIEKKLKFWQMKRIKNNPKTKQLGSMIISDDKELAFWPNYENQGPLVFSRFKERLNKISNFS